jgi:predicted GNAT family acetyltransferase
MNLVDNTALHRFELEERGLVAFANYRRLDKLVVIPHVEAPPPLRGTGTVGRLMAAIVEKARTDGFKVTPTCSYAVLWFRQHKNAQDVLG